MGNCSAPSSLAAVASGTPPSSVSFQPNKHFQNKETADTCNQIHIIHLLKDGIMTIAQNGSQICFMCENLRQFGVNMFETARPFPPPTTTQRRLPLYCCASCQSGFEGTVLHVDNDDSTSDIATHLRHLAKRSTENKMRLTDVVLHLEVSSCGKDRRECAICSEDYQFSLELPCGHGFHKSCIRQWFDNSRSCPVCRSDVPLTTLTPLSAAELMQCYTERELQTKIEMLMFYTAVDDVDVGKCYTMCQATEHHRMRASTLCSECTTDMSVLEVIDLHTGVTPGSGSASPGHHPSVAVMYPDNDNDNDNDTRTLSIKPEIEVIHEPEDANNKRILASRIAFMTGFRLYGITKSRTSIIPPPPPVCPLPSEADQSTQTAVVTVDVATRRCTIVTKDVQYTIACY